MRISGFCRRGRVFALVVVLLVMVPAVAMAADQAWRPKYDLAMKYLNFIILAAVIFKYAREPIKNFLKQQKDDVVAEMDKVEAEKARIVAEITAAKAQAAESELRLQEMKDRLVAQAEAKKQQLIEQAHQQCASMIEETRKKMETRILQAKDKLKMELADMALEQAALRLPTIITDADNKRFLDTFMKGMHLVEEAVS